MDFKKLIYYIIHIITGCKDKDMITQRGKETCSKCGRVYFLFNYWDK